MKGAQCKENLLGIRERTKGQMVVVRVHVPNKPWMWLREERLCMELDDNGSWVVTVK